MNLFVTGGTGYLGSAVTAALSPNGATGGSLDAAFPDVAPSALAGSDRPLVYAGGTWVHGSGDPITEESPANRSRGGVGS